jgi:CheY-like chemotaxis protein
VIIKLQELDDMPAVLITAPTALRQWKTETFIFVTIPPEIVLTVAFEYHGYVVKEKITSLSVKEVGFSTRLDSFLLAPGTHLEHGRIYIPELWIQVAAIVKKNIHGLCRMEYTCLSEEHQEYVSNYLSQLYWEEKTRWWRNRIKKPADAKEIVLLQHTNGHVPTVMLVENDAGTVKQLEALFQEDGYHVVVVRDSSHVKRMVAENNPDLLLMKIQMTPLDGLSIARRLKRDVQTWSVPIFMLSESENEEDLTDAFEVGAIQVFSKPLDIDKLLTDSSLAVAKEKYSKTQPESQLNNITILWSGDCAYCQSEIRNWAYLRESRLVVNPRVIDTVRMVRETRPHIVAFCSCKTDTHLSAVVNILKNWQVTKDIPTVMMQCAQSCKTVLASRQIVKVPTDTEIPSFTLGMLNSLYNDLLIV